MALSNVPFDFEKSKFREPSGRTGEVAVAVVNADGSSIGSSSSSSSSVGGGNNIYSNTSGDFTATANSGAKTITFSSYASTVLSSVVANINFLNAVIKRRSSAGAVDTLPLTNVSFATNVLTLSDMTANFAASDTVSVFVQGPDKAYDETNDWMKTSMQTAIAGEDTTADRLKVEHRYTPVMVTADTAVKSGAGFVHTLTFSPNDATPTAGTIIVYDNTAESGTKLFEWNVAATAFLPFTVIIDGSFSTGLYVGFTTTNDVNVTVSYR